ncbi:hypothetical protein J8273_0954 [Carpediemonas membranifera]|uniref:Uncharacterized protein n=1 Tax=Carpediemonas membranifera TaxID=201153 RepID=A0A8J6B7W8_9EUKA|nr:hypothetical protein J8273_0954 [Carpediemonas membranifera]|eukprot:KAG9397458.1 hypothetical protein J8273_0954 [Carpediemonas membranifera]
MAPSTLDGHSNTAQPMLASFISENMIEELKTAILQLKQPTWASMSIHGIPAYVMRNEVLRLLSEGMLDFSESPTEPKDPRNDTSTAYDTLVDSPLPMTPVEVHNAAKTKRAATVSPTAKRARIDLTPTLEPTLVHLRTLRQTAADMDRFEERRVFENLAGQVNTLYSRLLCRSDLTEQDKAALAVLVPAVEQFFSMDAADGGIEDRMRQTLLLLGRPSTIPAPLSPSNEQHVTPTPTSSFRSVCSSMRTAKRPQAEFEETAADDIALLQRAVVLGVDDITRVVAAAEMRVGVSRRTDAFILANS